MKLNLVVLVLVGVVAVASSRLSAADTPSPVAPLVNLVKSGRLPPERLPQVVEMLGQRGNADDLSYLLSQAANEKTWPAEVRGKALAALLDAAKTRKLKPTGDLTAIRQLIEAGAGSSQGSALQAAAIQLAALWQVEGAAEVLEKLALAPKTGDALRSAAIEGLVSLGGEQSQGTLEKLAAAGQPIALRYRAIAALAKVNLPTAAKAAAAALAVATPRDDPELLLNAFLNRQQGAAQLAAALAETKLHADVAKLVLRTMYSVGHSDAALSDLLSKAAGIAADPPLPTQDEVQKIAAEVAAKGSAARGEEVFRRADVNCLKCHAVSKAGGEIGPELSAIGLTSPVDYVVNSILNPDLAIKEQYVTKIIVTADGQVLQGIVVDRDDQRVRLKDATGRIVEVPLADIDEEREGKSLMPRGLTKFLTHEELLDLAKFVSELGKPGPYALRTTPTIQRWRVLREVPEEVAGKDAPNVELLRQFVLDAPPSAWVPVYAKVSGVLPLADARAAAKENPSGYLYLQGEIEVTAAGKVGFVIDSVVPTTLWIESDPFDVPQTQIRAGSTSTIKPIEVELSPGRHRITLRALYAPGIQTAAEESATIAVELTKPADSTAQFQPVGGQ